ncbi:MAG: domain 2 [Verrucomicrobia bacterium]|jgi:hypothetical protein|nr:domain 2 [Verrucomicrobiota bacterium]
MQPYKTPILSTISNLFGAFMLLGAVGWIFLAFTADNAMPLYTSIGFTVFLALSALIQFGTAQVIDYLGRTAHSSERLCHILENSFADRLTSLENRLSSAAPLTVRIDTAPPPPGFRHKYFYSIDGSKTGPLSADEVRKLWGDNVVRDHTPVLQEGDTQWRTYAELLSLKK